MWFNSCYASCLCFEVPTPVLPPTHNPNLPHRRYLLSVNSDLPVSSIWHSSVGQSQQSPLTNKKDFPNGIHTPRASLAYTTISEMTHIETSIGWRKTSNDTKLTGQEILHLLFSSCQPGVLFPCMWKFTGLQISAQWLTFMVGLCSRRIDFYVPLTNKNKE